jgi:hypothetical protein
MSYVHYTPSGDDSDPVRIDVGVPSGPGLRFHERSRTPLGRFVAWWINKLAGTALESPLKSLFEAPLIVRLAVAIVVGVALGAITDLTLQFVSGAPESLEYVVVGFLAGGGAGGLWGAVVGALWAWLIGVLADSVVSTFISESARDDLGPLVAWCVTAVGGWFAGKLVAVGFERFTAGRPRLQRVLGKFAVALVLASVPVLLLYGADRWLDDLVARSHLDGDSAAVWALIAVTAIAGGCATIWLAAVTVSACCRMAWLRALVAHVLALLALVGVMLLVVAGAAMVGHAWGFSYELNIPAPTPENAPGSEAAYWSGLVLLLLFFGPFLYLTFLYVCGPLIEVVEERLPHSDHRLRRQPPSQADLVRAISLRLAGRVVSHDLVETMRILEVRYGRPAVMEAAHEEVGKLAPETDIPRVKDRLWMDAGIAAGAVSGALSVGGASYLAATPGWSRIAGIACYLLGIALAVYVGITLATYPFKQQYFR